MRDLCSKITVKRNAMIPTKMFDGDIYIENNLASPLFRLEDPVSIFIWDLISEDKTLGNIASSICNNFSNVDYDEALQDATGFILKLYQASFVNITSGIELLEYLNDNIFGYFSTSDPENNEISFRVSDKLNSFCENNNIPLTFHFEVTHKCNFSCVHCYNRQEIDPYKKEMTTEKIYSVIDELNDAGVFYLSFTGGEVFTRKDFLDILTYACKKKMIVSVLTNASLIPEDFYKTLEEYKSINLEISIYGFSQNTYRMVTNSKIDFNNILNTLNRLKMFSDRIILKYVAMHNNVAECSNFIEYCKNNGFIHALNPGVFYPAIDGNKKTQEHNLTYDDYRALLSKGILPAKKKTFSLNCVMGKSRGAITPEGDICPCEFLTEIKFGNINTCNFKAIWYGRTISEFREKMSTLTCTECASCDKKEFCGRCPAFSFLENGSFDKAPKIWCGYSDISMQFNNE